MTIIADRGLFIRILTASGKVGMSEAESYADALDGATKDPATKADLAEVRAEIAVLAHEIKSLDRRNDERLGAFEQRMAERLNLVDDRFGLADKRLDERLDAQTNKLLVRVGAVGAALAGILFAALRYATP